MAGLGAGGQFSGDESRRWGPSWRESQGARRRALIYALVGARARFGWIRPVEVCLRLRGGSLVESKATSFLAHTAISVRATRHTAAASRGMAHWSTGCCPSDIPMLTLLLVSLGRRTPSASLFSRLVQLKLAGGQLTPPSIIQSPRSHPPLLKEANHSSASLRFP
jgi:hypothetical protein